MTHLYFEPLTKYLLAKLILDTMMSLRITDQVGFIYCQVYEVQIKKYL